MHAYRMYDFIRDTITTTVLQAILPLFSIHLPEIEYFRYCVAVIKFRIVGLHVNAKNE